MMRVFRCQQPWHRNPTNYRIFRVKKCGAPKINLHTGETILPSCSCLITGIISTSLVMPLLDSAKRLKCEADLVEKFQAFKQSLVNNSIRKQGLVGVSPRPSRSKCHLCCILLRQTEVPTKTPPFPASGLWWSFAIEYSLKPLLILLKIKASWILYSPAVNWGLLLTYSEIWKTVIMNQPKSTPSCLRKCARTGKVHVCTSSLITLQASHPYHDLYLGTHSGLMYYDFPLSFHGRILSFSIYNLWQGLPSLPLRVWCSEIKREKLCRSLPFLKRSLANPTYTVLEDTLASACGHCVQSAHLRLIIPCSQLGKAPSSCMTFWACVSLNQRRVAPLLSFLIFASSPVCWSVPRTGQGTEGFKKLSKGVYWKEGEKESQQKQSQRQGTFEEITLAGDPIPKTRIFLREDQSPTPKSCLQFLKGPDHAFYLTTVGQDSYFS